MYYGKRKGFKKTKGYISSAARKEEATKG